MFLAMIIVLVGRTVVLRIHVLVLPKLALIGGLIGTAVACFFWSLAYLPLANAIAIFFVEPLILTLFSAGFLREPVGMRRYGAVIIGLVGALVVIRPNWSAFGAAAILPLLAALCYAAQFTIIRSVRLRTGGLQLQFYSGMFAAFFLGLLLLIAAPAQLEPLEWTFPPPSTWLLLALLGFISAIAHMMIVVAIGQTEANILAPFQYLEIVSATLLGLAVFGDFPDPITWIGTGIILVSGMYVFYRERVTSSPSTRRNRNTAV
jgi:drug/metabolite transporter (DMT)-like permease